MTSWFCDCWTATTTVDLDDLEAARRTTAVSLHADRRIRSVAADSAALPEVRLIFELDADSEDQARARAATVVTDAVAGGHLEPARWTYRVRVVG